MMALRIQAGKLSSSLVALLLTVSVPTAAHADVVCSGTVLQVLFEADGLLVVDYGFGGNQFCYVDRSISKNLGPYGTRDITKEYCQSLLANFMTAKENGKQIQMIFALSACPVGQTLPQFPYAIVFK